MTMIKKLSLMLVSLLTALSVQAAPPTEASIDKLLAVTRAERLIDSVYGNINQMLRQTMGSAMQGKSVTPAQQRILDTLPGKFEAIFRDEMAWPKLRAMYVAIYQESLTQEEIDGMIAFYETPAGKAMIEKLPQVMNRTMLRVQAMMPPMMERVQKLVSDTIEEAKAAQ
jgi:hypothetical protein